ncbi:MAG: HepT-like ribonuclease domain-containing protein, partial [Burkholderiales bacterium]
ARKVSHVLHDILEAIERVEEITRGKTLADFEASWQLRWLVQRAIEIMSEASRAIPKELKDAHPEIPWEKVRGIGNVLRHDYQGIADPLIWNVVLDELPVLKRAVQAMLATDGDDQPT